MGQNAKIIDNWHEKQLLQILIWDAIGIIYTILKRLKTPMEESYF